MEKIKAIINAGFEQRERPRRAEADPAAQPPQPPQRRRNHRPGNGTQKSFEDDSKVPWEHKLL